MNDEYKLSEQDYLVMAEMEQEERCNAIVSEINAIRRSTLQTVLLASMEIGRLLIEAKEKLPHGAWGDWLSDNFEYSQSTANNLMRLYTEYGEKAQISIFDTGNIAEVFGHLSPSQALALLPLPMPERREFVETHDMEKTSVRDIEAEIKARKELEKRVKELEEEKSQWEEEVTNVTVDLENKIGDIEAQKDREIKRLEKELKEAQDPKTLKEKEKELKKKIEEKAKKDAAAEKERLEKELKEAQEAAKAADAKVADAEEKARKEAFSEYSGKLLELEARAKDAEARVSGAANAAVQKFAILFENYQRTWEDMKTVAEEIGWKDGETAAKLRRAMTEMAAQMSNE